MTDFFFIFNLFNQIAQYARKEVSLIIIIF
jgi:hypothetical protein